MSTQRLLILFGGVSSEHEISIRSATSVLSAVDRTRFTPVVVGIRRDGRWMSGDEDAGLVNVLADGTEVTDVRALKPDVVFPVLHGPHGEDGTIQGMLEVLGLPYVGSGVLASALCMDKAVQKHVVSVAAPEVPLAAWVEVDARQGLDGKAAAIADEVGLPCFVKPANLGSSVGVVRAVDVAGLQSALAVAARYDHKLVVEQGIDAREIEVAVLGNGGEESVVSAPGEIGLPPSVWYDYDTKYINDVATLHIPADLPAAVADRIRGLALQSFRVTGCRGLARIDFLLDRTTATPYLNELNTMPGFTSISMYPKLIEHAGIGYGELITRLCDLGLAYHRERGALSIDK